VISSVSALGTPRLMVVMIAIISVLAATRSGLR
jgi:hypothetical protein